MEDALTLPQKLHLILWCEDTHPLQGRAVLAEGSACAKALRQETAMGGTEEEEA